MDSCKHLENAFRRVICLDSREHIEEVCLNCGVKLRKDWVSRAEVIAAGCDPDALPISRDLRKTETPLGMFEGQL